MRVVTWNVNSLRARQSVSRSGSPRCSPTCCCSRRPSSPTTPSRRCRSRRWATSARTHGQGQWNGVAILSKVGLDDVVPTSPAASTRSRRPDHHRHVWRRRVSSVLRAQRAIARRRPLPVQAVRGSTGCSNTSADTRPDQASDRRGRLQHRARRPRRARPGEVRGATHVSQPSATGSPTRGVGSRRRLPPQHPDAIACTRGGTIAPATSTRAAACGSICCSARRSVAERCDVVRDRPQRPQGQAAERSRPGHRRPRRLTIVTVDQRQDLSTLR